MKRALIAIMILALTSLPILTGPAQASVTTPSLSAPKVDPLLLNFLGARVSAHLPVVITYKRQPGATEFSQLQRLESTKRS